jgi:rubrerythrin
MSKRRIPRPEQVVPSEVLERTRKATHPQKVVCVVCGSECASNSPEQLCWVCRRLKISAWHEAEQQMPAQE